MTRFHSTKLSQRGDMLIEAMIGLLLMSIIGLALSMAAGRASNAQKDMNVRNIAVTQMRDLLQRNGSGTLDLCSQSTAINLPGSLSLPVTVSGCATTSVTVGGLVIADVALPLRLSITHKVLGGTLNVGGGA